MRRTIGGLLLALLGWASVAHSATYYVATNGNDSTPCNSVSLGSPKRNIATPSGGLSCLQGAGDVLYIRAGTYNEVITNEGGIATHSIPNGQSWNNPTPGGSVVWIGGYFDGSSYELPRIEHNNHNGVLSMDWANYVIYDHLHLHNTSNYNNTLTGSTKTVRFQYGELTMTPPNPPHACNGDPSTGGPDTGLQFQGCLLVMSGREDTWPAEGIQILHNYAHGTGCGHGFYIQGYQNGLVLDGNTWADNGGYGGQIYVAPQYVNNNCIGPPGDRYEGVRFCFYNMIVRNNIFQGNGYGVDPFENPPKQLHWGGFSMTACHECKVYNNLFYDNFYAMDVGRESFNTEIYNNTFWNNPFDNFGGAIVLTAQHNTTIRNNVAVGSGKALVTDNGGVVLNEGSDYTGSNNLYNVNPPFVNPGAGDFHLQSSATATAIDRGVCLSAVPTDKDGATRPQGATCDIGAYEFGGTIIVPGPTNLRFSSQPQTTPAGTTLPPVVVDATDASGNLVSSFTGNIQVSLVSGAQLISKLGWTVPFVDSFETTPSQSGLDYRGERAIDGNPNLLWVTPYNGVVPPYPHEIQLNMQQVYSVGGFRYLPDQTLNGARIAQYEIYTSLTGGGACNTWGAPAATGTWVDSAAEKEVLFAPRNAQYVCLRGLNAVSGGPWASAAELNVLQGSGSGVGTLHGTLTRAAVAGRATFADLSVDAGGTYSLLATNPLLTSASSTSFTSTTVASSLAFIAQPTTVLIGQALPPVTVRFFDGAGNVINTTQLVTLVLAGCSGATLSGTANRAAVAVIVRWWRVRLAWWGQRVRCLPS
jgi:F5/8 type C domain/Right handed beta helix region